MRLVPRGWGRRRWAAAAALVLAVGAGGAWAVGRTAPPAAASTTQVAASSSTIRQTVTATGTIEPASRADLSFAVAGTVSSVPVAVGDPVRAGETVATIAPGDLQSAAALAQASVTAAQTQLGADRSSGASAAQVASAQAQVAAAQSRLADGQLALKEATLTSPIAGTVASVSITVGDRVGSGGSTSAGGSSAGGGTAGGQSGTGNSSAASTGSSGTAAVTVISTTAWRVDAQVDSADLASLRKGLQAEITPTGSSTRVFGTVKTVGIIASTSGGTATFPVTIAVTGSPSGLYAGGSASVAIIVKQVPDVLTVPTAAVHTSGGRTVVYQLRGGKQVSTAVTIGAVYGPLTQVVTGLRSGDQVVVPETRGGGRTRQGGGAGGAGGFRGGGVGSGGFGGGGFGGGGFGGGAGAPGGGAQGGGG